MITDYANDTGVNTATDMTIELDILRRERFAAWRQSLPFHGISQDLENSIIHYYP